MRRRCAGGGTRDRAADRHSLKASSERDIDAAFAALAAARCRRAPGRRRPVLQQPARADRRAGGAPRAFRRMYEQREFVDGRRPDELRHQHHRRLPPGRASTPDESSRARSRPTCRSCSPPNSSSSSISRPPRRSASTFRPQLLVHRRRGDRMRAACYQATMTDKRTITVTVNGTTLHQGSAGPHHARRFHPLRSRPHRHPPRLRARRLRRLHHPARRPLGALLPDAGGAGRRPRGAHRRGHRARRPTSCTRCRRRSATTTGCNAASARRGCSPHYWNFCAITRTRPSRRCGSRSPATSAAAPAIRASCWRRSTPPSA